MLVQIDSNLIKNGKTNWKNMPKTYILVQLVLTQHTINVRMTNDGRQWVAQHCAGQLEVGRLHWKNGGRAKVVRGCATEARGRAVTRTWK